MKNKIKYVFAILIYFSLVYAISIVERGVPDANIKSFSDALWYSFVTLTTVGYGDFYPVGTIGKVLSMFVILGSLGLLGYSIGLINSLINSFMEKKRTGFYATKIKNHFVIIGWNEFALVVSKEIYNAGHKVVFVTDSMHDLDLIKNLFHADDPFVLFTDYSNIEDLHKVNISNSKAVFVNFTEDTDTLVFVINVKSMYSNLNIVINSTKPDLKDTMLKAGVSSVVSRNKLASSLLASYLFEPNVAEYTEDLISTSTNSCDQDISQFLITSGNIYIGFKYIDAYIDLKKAHNTILIALVVSGVLDKDPADDTIIEEGNYFVFISRGDTKDNLTRLFGVNEGV